ncbi:hypothetical protein Pmani_013482 [Petrolisthes manimaculis]|uniref:Uncharacterized protein n=1 Tax=Petrolisthes manimaculis TaxID=1843537 RepID=A0AAE1PWE6_9EUCA|nr:hypothetical protein Pmani_013482 [Petrolisthes manimaculis]
MRFHPEKCKLMHMGSTNPKYQYRMAITGEQTHTLQTVKEIKDLGVAVDHLLKFSSHIQAQVNKANRVLGALKHTFTALDSTAFLNLYKSQIRPHLEYTSAVWNPKLKRDKDSLERVQRRATRLVEGLERSYCGGAMFEPSLCTTTRGHNLKLQVQHQLGPKKNFYSARVTDAWNSLSQYTINATSVESFKARLHKEWSTKPDLYQYCTRFLINNTSTSQRVATRS